MGIKIHYKGTLNSKDQVYQLIEEVKDIAQIMSWSYAVLDEDWETQPTAKLVSGKEKGIYIEGECGLKGIHFRAKEEADPIWLYFNAKGHLTAPFQVALEAEEGYPMGKPWIATKTDIGGYENHSAIIKLFRHLQSKFISDLQIKDNAGYWDGNNEEELKNKFSLAENMLAQVDSTLENLDPQILENPQLIDKMIEDLLEGLGTPESPE